MRRFNSPWRMRLQPASYNGVRFFVEADVKAGGRRIAVHEYPKRDVPYAEDMGRRAKRFSVTAYVIGPDFEDQRDALIDQFEALGNGELVRPTTIAPITVVVDTYSVTERREKGGYAFFEINFIEAGQNLSDPAPDTQSQINGAVDNAVGSPTVANTAAAFMNSKDLSGLT